MALAWLCFERPWYRPQVPSVVLSENWAQELRDSEALLATRPGQAKEVSWAAGEGHPTPWAFAYLHGFSASRREISPTLEQVSIALGANVFWSRLTAHGFDGEAFRKLSPDDLFRDSEEAYQILQKIGQKKVLVGTSTGATLAVAQALWHPDLTAMILISPNFGAANKAAWLAGGPFGTYLGHAILGDYYEWKPRSELHGQFWNTKYRVEGLTALLDMVNAVRRMPVRNLKVPCLVLLTESDLVVDTQKTLQFLAKAPAGTCQIRWIKAEDHVLAGDILSPSSTAAVVEEILGFLRELPAS